MTDDVKKDVEKEIKISTDENNIDFDKELESLDDFLNEQNDDDFALDDESEFAVYDESRQQQKSGGAGKVIGSAFLIAVLGGVAYAGVTYGPQFMNNKDLMALQENMINRAENFELPVFDDAQISEDTNLPVASDLDGTLSEEAKETPEDNNQTVVTIAEALSMVQAAKVNSDVVPEGEEDASIEAAVPAQENNDMAENETGMDAENLEPLPESDIAIANDVMAMDADEIIETIEAIDETVDQVQETATEANVLPQETEEIVVDAVEDVVEEATEMVNSQDALTTEEIDAAMDAIVLNTVDEAEDDIAIAEMRTDAEQAPNADDSVDQNTEQQKEADVTPAEAVEVEQAEQPAMEVIAVETPKATPVDLASNEPKAKTPSGPREIVVNNRPVSNANPMVAEARAAYESGDFQRALNLYNDVLAGDAGNTAALTGKQLATAKLQQNQGITRTQAEPMTSKSTVVNATTNTIVTDVVPTAVEQTEVQRLNAAIMADPRNANTAVQLADAYRDAGDKVKALEWYRKALQLDVLTKAGIDRMSVYDKMAKIQ